MCRCFSVFQFLIFGVMLVVPCAAFATASITEVMYDLPGTDTGREWIEIRNTGSEAVSFSKWKLYEANTNHGLILFQGNATTSPDGFAIISDDTTKFLIDNPGYSGTLFGSSFSLSNSGELLELRLDGVAVSQVSYASTTGAAGDGNTLQRVGSLWQAALPTPGNAPGGQSTSPPDTQSESSTTSTTTPPAEEAAEASAPSSPAPASSSGSTWTSKPNIFVNAFAPQIGIAGAPVIFDAAAVGEKKEPLPNARYVWSFGDGGTLEGKKIQHTYHYSAVYVVMVTASSGEWSATDRKEITIAPPELVIAGIREGSNGFIEIQNNGKSDVDLSGWLLGSGSGFFTIPHGTLIGARKSIPFPAAITNLSAEPTSTTLLYPNGSVVVTYVGHVSEPIPATVAAPMAVPQPAPPPVIPEPKETSPEPPPPLPKEEAEVAPVAVHSPASRTLLLGAVGAAESSGTPYFFGTILLVFGVLGGYLIMLRSKQEAGAAEKLRREATTYDIIEDS